MSTTTKIAIAPASTLPAGTTLSSSTTSSAPATGTLTPPVVPKAALTALGMGLVDPLPKGVTPTPPSPTVDIPLKEFRGFYPKVTQVGVVPLVVQELNASTDYVMRFGGPAPAASTVASALQLASDWRLVRDAADAWARYVHTQDGFAWKNALTLLGQLEPLFQAAVLRDPSVAESYAGLTRFYAAPKVASTVAAATKKANAQANAAKVAAPAAVPATTEAPAASRVVTVPV